MSSHQSLPVTVLPKKPSRHATRRLASSGLKVTQDSVQSNVPVLPREATNPPTTETLAPTAALGRMFLLRSHPQSA